MNGHDLRTVALHERALNGFGRFAIAQPTPNLVAHAERDFGVVNVDGLCPTARRHQASLDGTGARYVALNVLAVVVFGSDLVRRVRGGELGDGRGHTKGQRRDGATKQ